MSLSMLTSRPMFVPAFLKALLRSAPLAIAMLMATGLSAKANDWNGDWNSNFGQLRLLQNGDRLYGDYQERGVIEGKISRDGRTARAVFVYNDGRWGYVTWRLANDKFSGTWNWSADGIPDPKSGKSWTATRASARTSPLKFSDQFAEKYPANNAGFANGPALNWIASVGGGSRAIQPNGTARAGLSEWYSGYTLSNLDPGFTIELDVIHFEGANTASVDISIFVPPGRTCPDAMHAGLCDELVSKANVSGSVDAQVTGVRMINLGSRDETLEATFRLPGDRNDRVLRVFDALNWYGATIHHPQRGYDYEGFAVSRPHLCEQAQCQDAVFDDIRNNPAAYRGNVDRGYVNRMINLPNRIDQSSPTLCCAPPPAPTPNSAPQNGPRPLLSDAWVILEETSENLGEISISPDRGSLAASGVLRGFFETGQPHDTVFTLAGSTDEAIAFDLVAYAGQSGESKTGRLLIELPAFARTNPRGTLIIGDEVLLVELVRPIPGLEPEEVGDTPAIGIYSVNYRLRDVPRDRSLRLRREPNRSSGIVGSISPNARQLQVLACAPEISAQRFSDADGRTRLNLLSASWCQVTNGQIAGWLPGRYLTPDTN